MKTTFIPSINSQTVKNFKIGFIINERHESEIKNFFSDNIIFFRSSEDAKNYCIINNIELQTRHDCDDWMKDNYIETIQKVYKENINTSDKFLIHSKVEKLDFKSGNLYRHGNDYSKTGFISMFLTLCQKKVENFVYEKNHRHMNEITKKIILLDSGFTRLVVHGNNIFSHISNSDIFLYNLNKIDLSLLIPTFDNIEYLQDCLDSIEKSKKNYNIEVLFGIDNCEKTKNFVLKNLNQFKPYVNFLFFDKSVGPYIIRNSLSEIAKSEKLLFVDSDDIIHENLIDKTVKTLATKDVFRFRFYNFAKKEELKVFDNKKINNFHTIGQLGILKTKFLSLNGYEPWLCGADSEFKQRESYSKMNVSYTNDVLYYRRRHTKNLTIKKETGQNSQIRNKYNSIILDKLKNKNFGKLPILSVYNCQKLISSQDTEIFKFKSITNLTLPEHYYSKLNCKLSILIPTFENTDFLDDCVNSVLSSVKDLECEIIFGIDNCQTTLNFIKNKIFDLRIRFRFFNKKLGPYIIRNSLASLSNSENLLFFDSDDIMLEKMIPDVIYNLGKSDIYKPMYLDFKNISEFDHNNLKKTNKYGEGVFAIKKSLFLSVNGFEPWICGADSDFMSRIYSRKVPLTASKDVVFLRRIHSNNLTVKPETNFSSKLRTYYYGLSKKRRPNGVCESFVTESSDVVKILINKPDDLLKFEEQKNKIDNLVQNLNINPVKREINYDKINQVIEKKGVYNPNSSKKPIRENTPNKRQELIDLKKGSIREQVNKTLPGKPNRRNNLPNIF